MCTRHICSPDTLVLDDTTRSRSDAVDLDLRTPYFRWCRVRLALLAARPDRPSATTDPRNRARAVYGLAQVRAGIHGPCVLEREAGCVCHHRVWYATLYRYGREISHRHRLAADRSPVDRRGLASRKQEQAGRDSRITSSKATEPHSTAGSRVAFGILPSCPPPKPPSDPSFPVCLRSISEMLAMATQPTNHPSVRLQDEIVQIN